MSPPREETTAASVAAEESAPTMPLMTGVVRAEGLPDATDFDVGAPAGGGRFVNQGTILIMLILVIAGGAIYAMRQGQKDRSAVPADSAAEAEIATALAKLSQTPEMGPNDALNFKALFDTNSIIQQFSPDHVQKQVPIEFIKKNPFSLVAAEPAQGQLIAPTSGNPVPRDTVGAQLKLELADLVLQSVLVGGPRPVAVINGQLLQQGQKIGNFTVKSIAGTMVELECQGRTFTLKMDTQADGGGAGSASPKLPPSRH